MSSVLSISSETTTFSTEENLLDLFYRVMTGRVTELDEDVRDKARKVEYTNEQLKKIQALQLQTMAKSMLDSDSAAFSAPTKINGDDSLINLGNGFGVVIEYGVGTNRSFKIVQFETDAEGNLQFDPSAPKFASETRVWGDPHVLEGHDMDIAQDNQHWMFKEQLTFLLPDGTKITVETSPAPKNPKQTFASSLYISRGNEQAVISGLENNTKNANTYADDTIVVAHDGSLFNDHDINDGEIVASMDGSAGDWGYLSGEDVVTGDYLTATEKTAEYLTVPLTDDVKQLLDQAGFNYARYQQDGALVLDEEGVELLDEALENLKDSMTSTSQLEQVQLQSSMGKYNQTFDVLSNFIKTYFSSINSIIRNQGA